jgi:hypothetical protein
MSRTPHPVAFLVKKRGVSPVVLSAMTHFGNSAIVDALNLKTAVGGEFFLTQRRREAENAEKIANL